VPIIITAVLTGTARREWCK